MNTTIIKVELTNAEGYPTGKTCRVIVDYYSDGSMLDAWMMANESKDLTLTEVEQAIEEATTIFTQRYKQGRTA